MFLYSRRFLWPNLLIDLFNAEFKTFFSGVVYLKNITADHWELKEGKADPFEIPEQDKQCMRDNIVEAVIHAPIVIRYCCEEVF